MRLKVFTAFSGYDSQCLALRRLGIDYELVGWSEIDKYAIQAHNALFPEAADRNYGDICKIDWAQVPDFDLFTYSFPCTDISAAGQQKGLEKGSGTRSSLLWECEKAIAAKRPKFLLMENVKALVQKKFVHHFNEWQTVLEGYGYANFAKVLNAKDYGVPQNRERIFLVSIRMDGLEGLAGNVQYYFPQPMPLGRRLKDVLEAEVDEKYYLSEKMMEYFNRVNADTSHCHKFKPKDGEDTAFTIRTAPATSTGWRFTTLPLLSRVQPRTKLSSTRCPGCVTAAKRDNTQNYVCCAMRGRGESGNTEQGIEPRKDDLTNTITTVQKDNMVLNATADGYARTIGTHYADMNVESVARKSSYGYGYVRTAVRDPSFRIRKLTPRECFRLMGVDDTDIDTIQAAGISNSQQYKMAGNSIVVDVLYHIFRKLLVEPGQEGNSQTLF